MEIALNKDYRDGNFAIKIIDMEIVLYKIYRDGNSKHSRSL